MLLVVTSKYLYHPGRSLKLPVDLKTGARFRSAVSACKCPFQVGSEVNLCFLLRCWKLSRILLLIQTYQLSHAQLVCLDQYLKVLLISSRASPVATTCLVRPSIASSRFRYGLLAPMFGENRQLVTNEPVEFKK